MVIYTVLAKKSKKSKKNRKNEKKLKKIKNAWNNFWGPCQVLNQAQNRKGCLTAPLSVTGGHILIHIGKFFGILYYWVYITNLTMIGGLLLCLL